MSTRVDRRLGILRSLHGTWIATRRMQAWAVVVVVTITGMACSGREPVEHASIEELRSRVASIRSSVEARLASEVVLGDSGLDPSSVAFRLSTPLLRDTLAAVAAGYLDDVELDLRPRAVVRMGDDVHVRIGPVNANAGRWDLEVTILRIRAQLGAREPETSVDETGRLRISLPADVLGGSGDARVRFTWDAAALSSIVCGDFEIDETFTATVAPRSYVLRGHFDMTLEAPTFAIAPRFDEEILVQPEPTEESWRRVREILDEHDRASCGIALNADALEQELRELVSAGFRFRLPDSVLRPVSLPLSVGSSLVVAGRRLHATVRPAGLTLTPGWLWYGVDLGLDRDVGPGDPPGDPPKR